MSPAVDFLEKPIALQKLLQTVKKALKHEVASAKPPLTLDAFARSPLLKDPVSLSSSASSRASNTFTSSNQVVLAGDHAGAASRTLAARSPDVAAEKAPPVRPSSGCGAAAALAGAGVGSGVSGVLLRERKEGNMSQLRVNTACTASMRFAILDRAAIGTK